MMDDAVEIDVRVIRKPPPPEPDPFRCPICDETIAPDPYEVYRRAPKERLICNACTRHWSPPIGRLRGATGTDNVMFARLKAITNRLNWEIHNGDDRWRRDRFHGRAAL